VFDHFTQLVSDAFGWAYAIVFLLALVHAVVPVVPNETAVITAGVVTSAGDRPELQGGCRQQPISSPRFHSGGSEDARLRS
jgi:hypothetical protein